MPYSSYDHDKLEAAETMRIERRIYFEAKDGDIAPYVSLPPEQLHAMRKESAAAEQAIFDDLKGRAAAWEEQAGKTLLLDKAIEYTRTTVVQHTSNKWQEAEYDRHTRSNRVYQMNYHIYENTRYDREKQQSVPYSYSLTWGVYTNSPSRNGQAKIAGQDRKVFSDKAAMEKYLNGRIKAYDLSLIHISSSYLSEDADILGAESAYAAMEAELQDMLDNIESEYPGYDEYRVNADEIEHDPYVLISILSALHEGVFTLAEAQSTLEMLFEKQYILTVEEEVQVRYRTETRTDSEGNEYEAQVPYNYYILHVDLENFNLSHVPAVSYTHLDVYKRQI